MINLSLVKVIEMEINDTTKIYLSKAFLKEAFKSVCAFYESMYFCILLQGCLKRYFSKIATT